MSCYKDKLIVLTGITTDWTASHCSKPFWIRVCTLKHYQLLTEKNRTRKFIAT